MSLLLQLEGNVTTTKQSKPPVVANKATVKSTTIQKPKLKSASTLDKKTTKVV